LTSNMHEERRKDYVDLGWIKGGIKAVGSALFVHFIAGIWWAATITSNVGFIKAQVSELKNDLKALSIDRYRGVDALRDFNIINEKMTKNESRIERLENKKIQ